MTRIINTEPLTIDGFAPFGDVIEITGEPDKLINQGKCGRFHDRAALDFSNGRAAISLFNAEPRTFPLMLEMVERHPEGSQAFVPMSEHGFLVIVAPDENGVPGVPVAFETRPGQAINFHRGTWHGVLTPLAKPGLFAVIDRVGDGENLEEYWFDTPFRIEPKSELAGR